MLPAEYPVRNHFDVNEIPAGTITKFWLEIVRDGLARPVCIPVLVARGKKPGPVLGVTAAVHGNEINGIPVVHRLFHEIDVEQMAGSVVAVPVVNAISYLRKQRRFNDGRDLNHIMPGEPDGDVSKVYASRFVERVISQVDYLLDLHTASFGRVNSYYIRANMRDSTTREMALLQNADIIVHNPPADGTLRGAAADMGIPAITLEVGDPNRFQRSMIRSGLTGVFNLLARLNMIDGDIAEPETPVVLCSGSSWMYTDDGGIIRVAPSVTELVKKGDTVASINDMFGQPRAEYYAPFDGIVIGKETNPVCQTGGRILHLGRIVEDVAFFET